MTRSRIIGLRQRCVTPIPIFLKRFLLVSVVRIGSAIYISLTVSRLSSASSAPVLGKRSRTADGPKHTHLVWLNELHGKIWNQQSRRPELFRGVNVTEADYTALQERLKELHPDRDEPDYDGSKHDVLSEKLNFLRPLSSAKGSSEASSAKASSAVVSSSPHHGPSDDEEEEDTEIKSLFPYLLIFWGLSPLAPKEKSPGRFTSPLLYR
jgi:hypothetical protein